MILYPNDFALLLKNNTMRKILLLIIGFATLQACSSSDYKKNPVDELVSKMHDQKPYTIVLQDMDVEGSFSHTYKHMYQVITEDADSVPSSKIVGWYEVSEQFFKQNENNLGMEIVSMTREGKLSKSAAPAGYGNYVGNSRYGQWQTGSNGNSFWSFYGKYMMMSTMFDLMRRPYYRNDYSHYRSGGYRGSNRSYYGQKSSTGSYRYGTNSSYNKKTRPDFFQRKASKRGWSSSSRRSNNSSTRSRTSSSRSRSGGFGK